MPLVHPHVSIVANGDVIFHDHERGRTLLFAPAQVKLFLELDEELRSGRFKSDQQPTPAGYEDFQRLWSLDPGNRYQLVALDYKKGEGAHLKKAIPKGAILPYGDAAPAPSPQNAEDDALIRRLLLRTAQQSLRASDNARAGFEEREARRDRKLVDRMRSQAVAGPNLPAPAPPAPNTNPRGGRRKRQRQRSPSVVLVDPELDALLTPLLATEGELANPLAAAAEATPALEGPATANAAAVAPPGEVDMNEEPAVLLAAAAIVGTEGGDVAGEGAGMDVLFGDDDILLFD